MAEKETTERRVYVLPVELVERLKNYQASNGIPSEVEAVRRLLDTALQMKDTVFTLLDKLIERSKTERDLRVLSRDVLALHPLVTTIKMDDGEGLTFYMKGGSGGRLSPELTAYSQDADEQFDRFTLYPQRVKKPSGRMSEILDDEIPF